MPSPRRKLAASPWAGEGARSVCSLTPRDAGLTARPAPTCWPCRLGAPCSASPGPVHTWVGNPSTSQREWKTANQYWKLSTESPSIYRATAQRSVERRCENKRVQEKTASERLTHREPGPKLGVREVPGTRSACSSSQTRSDSRYWEQGQCGGSHFSIKKPEGSAGSGEGTGQPRKSRWERMAGGPHMAALGPAVSSVGVPLPEP